MRDVTLDLLDVGVDNSCPEKDGEPLNYRKFAEFSVDSFCESVSLRIPLKGGTGSISGIGVLLWPGKPILCSR